MLAEYKRYMRNPATVHAMCEDYRACAGIDFDMDTKDFDAGRKIDCPVLLLWGATGGVGRNTSRARRDLAALRGRHQRRQGVAHAAIISPKRRRRKLMPSFGRSSLLGSCPKFRLQRRLAAPHPPRHLLVGAIRGRRQNGIVFDAHEAASERAMLMPEHGSTASGGRRIAFTRIGYVLSLGIFVAAVDRALSHPARHRYRRSCSRALKATDPRTLIIAGGFVAARLLTLTFYDLFALRTIGRTDVPYRIAALAGFTSYSVGHNVGASVFSGGAVRYRIYSAWGLSVIEVTKICFIAGLTFWLGNATVLGLGILDTPQAARALDQLPLWANRVIALVILGLLAAYIAWVWVKPRVIGRDGWQVTLPGGPMTLMQIGIGMFDLGCCAAAMYMLMPDEPNLGFVTVAVIFVAATLLGFASHAPGGLGVFDAAMMVALWQFDKEDLLAGLLLFRLLYYIIPFVLSLGVFGIREALLSRCRAAHISCRSTRSVSCMPGAPPRAREGLGRVLIRR